MKVSKLNQFNQTDHSAGFTLIELLVSISIMGIVLTLVGTGITLMVSSERKLAAAQSRRVEVSRALDVISYDIRKAENVNGTQNYTEAGGVKTPDPAATVTDAITADGGRPTLLSGDFTPVLFLKISIVCNDSTIIPERVIYSTKEKIAGDRRVGPNVLYRYGRIADENDRIPCSSNDPVNVPIADNITPVVPAATTPTCVAPAATPAPEATGVGANGFYTCVSDTQVSIALFAKLSDTLIYGDNRTIASGSITPTATVTGGSIATPTTIVYCEVPDLLTTPKTPSQANTAIRTEKDLSYAGIPTTGSSNVVSQTPSAGSKIRCKNGLVTYTY